MLNKKQKRGKKRGAEFGELKIKRVVFTKRRAKIKSGKKDAEPIINCSFAKHKTKTRGVEKTRSP